MIMLQRYRMLCKVCVGMYVCVYRMPVYGRLYVYGEHASAKHDLHVSSAVCKSFAVCVSSIYSWHVPAVFMCLMYTQFPHRRIYY